MNEAETRAELIDPKLKAAGWGVVEGSRILRERNVCRITDGRIQVGGGVNSRIILFLVPAIFSPENVLGNDKIPQYLCA